jgi:hypothetical protein
MNCRFCGCSIQGDLKFAEPAGFVMPRSGRILVMAKSCPVCSPSGQIKFSGREQNYRMANGKAMQWEGDAMARRCKAVYAGYVAFTEREQKIVDL